MRIAEWLLVIVVCILARASSVGSALAQNPQASPQAGSAESGKLDHEALLRMLHADEPESVRQAAEAIQKATPKRREELVAVTEAVKAALGTTKDAAAERAVRLAP